jgi:hypothetical protein
MWMRTLRAYAQRASVVVDRNSHILEDLGTGMED